MIVTSDEIVNSHDRFFKSVFSNKEEAADFLLNYRYCEGLKEDTLIRITWERLSITYWQIRKE
ncbi:MAG: hypothetical protein HQK58_07370 [Deltaproteobacteria bacterium]|nr:hypothetical protein [Deltaproteobacteria bacterium]